ncbi:MAG: hypothetical protein H6719_25120 [Sandaracinaceae bacterium]|nr:hypothetical protein [Sandaracinaceae bacterium]
MTRARTLFAPLALALLMLAWTAPSVAQRASTRVGSGRARRIVMEPGQAYVLQEDGVLVAWTSDAERVPSYRFSGGPVPGATGLVDFCGTFGVQADGAVGEMFSNGSYRPGTQAVGARSCGYRLLEHTLCFLDGQGAVRCRYDRDGEPVVVPGIRGATRVDVGDGVCALVGDHVTCWTSTSAPRVLVSDVTTFSRYAGSGCGIQPDGELVCWASRNQRRPFDLSFAESQARCRAATTDEERDYECVQRDTDAQPPSPVGIHDAVDVTIASHTGVVIRRDGRVLAWGQHPGFWNHDDAVAEVPWLRGARHVEIGRSAVCAILADGHAACWSRTRP